MAAKGQSMIGPAELDDLMLEYADAHAAADEAGCSDIQDSAAKAWSWGLGPTQGTMVKAKAYLLVKQQGRFAVVEQATGRTIYTPPDFLAPQTRGEFDLLLASLNVEERLIDTLMVFEREATSAAQGSRYMTSHSESLETRRAA